MLLKKIKIIGKNIQKTIAIALLFILYIFGFGISFVIARVFHRHFFEKKCESEDSFWIKAVDYDETPDELTRQS
jgi:membrane protein DedA with SNARE-associated domain